MHDNDMNRRKFLASTGLALGMAALPAFARAQETTATETAEALPEDQKVGWAIAGLGNFATGPILKSIHECKHTRVTGLVTRDPEGKGQKIAAEYKVDPAAVVNLENMDKLADRKDIDVVYVITPNVLHLDYCLAAIKAGKHVFCEKPFAGSEADCQAILDAAEKAGKLVGLGYRMRFDPANISAIQILKDKGLGALKTLSGEFGFNVNTSSPAGEWRVDKERSGGGSLMDIGVYGVNAARFLTGEEPNEISGHVFATPGDPRFTEVEETAMFRFSFPSGVQFQAISSYGITGVNRVRAIGSTGWLDMEPAISYEGAKMKRSGKGGNDISFDKTNHFALMMDDFSQAVREGRPARSTGMDGLLDVRYMEAIYKSASEGGKSIKL